MKTVKTAALFLILCIVVCAFASCGDKKTEADKTDSSESAQTEKTDAGTDGEKKDAKENGHGVITYVTYSCSDVTDENRFFFKMNEDEFARYLFSAWCFVGGEEIKFTDKEVALEEMNALRDIFAKYDYEKYVGQKASSGAGDDAAGATSYSLNLVYSDGTSIDIDTAGEAGNEIIGFFTELAFKMS